MNQHPEIIVGVFAYRDAADQAFSEILTDELGRVGVDTDNIHMFVPPFGFPEIAGNAGAGIHNAIQALGVDRDTAIWCEREYRDGHIVVVVRPESHFREVEDIFQRHGTMSLRPAGTRPATHQADSHLEAEPREEADFRDRPAAERHGRRLEPDLTETDEPLVHDVERQKRRIGW